MDDIGCLVTMAILGGIIALIVYSQKQANQTRLAMTNQQMQPYQEAYAKALESSDPHKIATAGSALLAAARHWQAWSVAAVSENVYRDSLKLLKAHPDLKPFVLSAGRVAYGSKRPTGEVTIYDEQAITNDISAHS